MASDAMRCVPNVRDQFGAEVSELRGMAPERSRDVGDVAGDGGCDGNCGTGFPGGNRDQNRTASRGEGFGPY